MTLTRIKQELKMNEQIIKSNIKKKKRLTVGVVVSCGVVSNILSITHIFAFLLVQFLSRHLYYSFM